MAQPKCANCGEPMLQTFTQTGLKLYVCPHTKMNIVKGKGRMMRQGFIYCHIDIKGLCATFENMTKGSQTTLEKLRHATRQTLSDADLLENANLAIILGLPINDLPELFEATTKLGYALGIETKKAIEALCIGVGRRSRLRLDNIGIVVFAKDANAWFATEHKLDKLDETQKTEAWQKYAIKLIIEKANKL